MQNEMIVLAGPTAVGKTETAIRLAEALGCEIISADSRQVYSEMEIGTAAPTTEELKRARHHMVRCRTVENPMNAFDYEQSVMRILPGAFERGNGRAILTGGSMMYVDAVLRGIDEMPDIPEELRSELKEELESRGLAWMQERLRTMDPEYYKTGDMKNPRRVLHAIELCIVSGRPASALRSGNTKRRPFRALKLAAMRPREELYERIELRVDRMMEADNVIAAIQTAICNKRVMREAGLEQEAGRLVRYSHLTPLNTVGYREMFAYLNGEYPREEAIRLIKRNTRHYAKKQLTWIKADGEYEPISPVDTAAALKIIEKFSLENLDNKIR